MSDDGFGFNDDAFKFYEDMYDEVIDYFPNDLSEGQVTASLELIDELLEEGWDWDDIVDELIDDFWDWFRDEYVGG